MEKKILRLQKRSNAIFKLFQKMIDKLTKHNEKLLAIYADARIEMERQQEIMKSADVLILENEKQIKKLEQLIGKEDCCGL